jgi:hypothetical protein
MCNYHGLDLRNNVNTEGFFQKMKQIFFFSPPFYNLQSGDIRKKKQHKEYEESILLLIIFFFSISEQGRQLSLIGRAAQVILNETFLQCR